jgi:pimeloyl-ACP methyl ester carboxylesterase
MNPLRKVFPGLPYPVLAPLYAESRLPLEAAGLMRSAVFSDPPPTGHGQGILLVPGLLAGDWSLALMASWLRRVGYEPAGAGMGVNVNCSNRLVDQLAARAEDLAERTGGRVAVIGHSRGGSLTRALAVRRPDLISGIVCLGSPLNTLLNVAPWTWGTIFTIGLAGHAIPGLFTTQCWNGACCEQYNAESRGPFPANVAFISIHSTRDGIVDWRGCVHPAAENLAVQSSHFGMAVDDAVYEILRDRLRDLTDDVAESASGNRTTGNAHAALRAVRRPTEMVEQTCEE